MKSKTVKIWYWVTTILFALFMLFSGITELMMTDSSKAIIIGLGYPVYLLYILGIAKILGSIAILQTKFFVIKEWAYAGFTIDVVGAIASMLFAGFSFMQSVPVPALVLVVLFISYFAGKRIGRI